MIHSTRPSGPKVLIVGCQETNHVGGMLQKAALAAGLESSIIDHRSAYEGNPVIRRLNWWVRGRVPNRLGEFGREVLRRCRERRPDIVITTGIAPVPEDVLRELGETGARLCNYLTDDPWNAQVRSKWFLRALPVYDWVFSPRTANLDDLVKIGCRNVEYLPFAYDPDLHFPPELSEEDYRAFRSDVAVVGGAYGGRAALVGRLIDEGLDASLWGEYWKRYPNTRAAARGYADPETMRRVIASTSIALGLVNRLNRDGHAMRSYEVAAIGAPMLVEETAEHRDLYGPDGECVYYFDNEEELVAKAHRLVDQPEEGRALAEKVRDRIRSGANTYGDRFHTIVETALA